MLSGSLPIFFSLTTLFIRIPPCSPTKKATLEHAFGAGLRNTSTSTHLMGPKSDFLETDDFLADESGMDEMAEQFFDALNTSDVVAVERLLGVDRRLVNMTSAYGDYPLHVAAAAGSMPVIQLLLMNGANVNCVESLGASPLFIASFHGHREVADVLAVACVPRVNRDRSHLLHWAAADGLKHYVRILIWKGENVNARNHSGETALHCACLSNRASLARIMIDAGADVSIANAFGNTPLHVASQKGNLEVVQLLLASGANVNTRNTDGCTAAAVAVEAGQMEVYEFLSDYSCHSCVKRRRVSLLS